MLGGSPKIDTIIYASLRMLAKQYESRNANIASDAGFVQKVSDLY